MDVRPGRTGNGTSRVLGSIEEMLRAILDGILPAMRFFKHRQAPSSADLIITASRRSNGSIQAPRFWS